MPPEISVVLATSSLDVARRSLDGYCAQTAAGAVEVLLVAPRAELERVDPQGAPSLGALRLVESTEPFELATARATGVRAASAPWVFIGETHSFAEPTLVAQLLAAIARSPASTRPSAFVPCIFNVNPTGAVSCASFLVDYGAWGPGHAEGERLPPPIYNGVFARALLVRLEGELPKALSPHDDSLAPVPMEPEHWAPFVPQARIGHLNIVRFGDFVRSKSQLGLAVAGARARRWRLGRRIAYAAASPLIAAVLLGRYLRHYRIARSVERLPPGTAPLLVVGAVVRAAAEALGYLGWSPAALFARLEHLEIYKIDYVPGWTR
jgi:hypothetical protein